MHSASTLLTVYFAPKDAYSYVQFKEWHTRIKRKWRYADVMGADEVKVVENNRRLNTQYNRPLKIMGWTPDTNIFADGRSYEKKDSNYQDIVGDTYFDYFKKFNGYILDWWGLGGKFKRNAKAARKARNPKSIPNTPMLDVSIHLDSNSMMEKMYLQGMSYDEATSSTFKGKSQEVNLINELTEFNKKDGMDEDKAYQESLRLVEIIQRNITLGKNSPIENEYNFMVNYYNRFINKKMREMMKIQMNFWFLKEAMTHHPNLSFYVLGPYNLLYRIQGIVGKRDQNVIVQLEQFINSKKYQYEYTYSLSRDTLVNDADKGYIPAAKLTRDKNKILNLMYGRKKLKVDHRYRTENFYDLILQGHLINGRNPWIDAMHNCWVSPDYSNPKNLQGLEIIC